MLVLVHMSSRYMVRRLLAFALLVAVVAPVARPFVCHTVLHSPTMVQEATGANTAVWAGSGDMAAMPCVESVGCGILTVAPVIVAADLPPLALREQTAQIVVPSLTQHFYQPPNPPPRA